MYKNVKYLLMKQVLMSPPDYFKVEYAINPWMKAGTRIDLDLAKSQWNNLKRSIELAGAEVKTVNPNENHPDLVFTANSAIINNKQVLSLIHISEPTRPY